MCGIAGVLGRAAGRRAINRGMIDRMAHRGPDGAGDWLSDDGQVWLGHARLAIIDLSDNGAQPMVSPDGRFVITFNGEIYNYIEVREELKRLGARFHSDSDTEVIVEAYRRFGAECLSRLNGMFAFAIVDTERKVAFCARDRFGEKPFLYARGEGFLAFASEYKALLSLPEISTDYDPVRIAMESCAAGGALDRERQTVFAAIEQLLPAEAMEIDLATLQPRIWRYWDVSRTERRRFGSDADAFAEFHDLFMSSVALRLRADVTVGSCLSGGLDSGAIAGAVRKLLGDGPAYNTFTGRFPGTAADEWQYARETCAFVHSDSHVVEPTVERFIADLPDFVWLNELPVSTSSQFAQWCVFRLAKENATTVLLDGQGADEILGGYPSYFAAYLASLDQTGDRARRAAEEPRIRARYPVALLSGRTRLQASLPLVVRRFLARTLGKGADIAFGLRDEFVGAVSTGVAQRDYGFPTDLQNVLYGDSFSRFLSALLRYGDRNSMAHSREVRLPFCDHRIAEFAFSLPPHLLMGEAQNKRLVREGLGSLMPQSVATRWEKQGFRPPQELWCETPAFAALLRETFASASFASSSVFEPKWWRRTVDRIEAGERGLAWAVWQPFIVEMWRKHFLDRVKTIEAPAHPKWERATPSRAAQPAR